MADFEVEPPDGPPSHLPAPLSEPPRRQSINNTNRTLTDEPDPESVKDKAKLQSRQEDKEEEFGSSSELDEEEDDGDELSSEEKEEDNENLDCLIAKLRGLSLGPFQSENAADWHSQDLHQKELEYGAEINKLSEHHEAEKTKLEAENAELRDKLAKAEKQRDAALEKASTDRGIGDEPKQAEKETEDALREQRKRHKKGLKKAAKQHDDELAVICTKMAEFEKKLAETTKSNSRIAGEVELVVLSNVEKSMALIQDYEAAKAQVQQLLDAPADPARKTAWLIQQAKSHEMQKDFCEFMDEFIRRLYENKFTADGIAQIKTWDANESFRPKNLPAPPTQPRYNDSDAAMIYKEGQTAGFYDAIIQEDLKCVLMEKYKVTPPEGFEERIRFLRNPEDKRHPRQRGFEAAALVSAGYWAKELGDPALDTRVFKTPQLGTPHIPLVGKDKRLTHFWTAFEERILELAAGPHERRKKMGEQGG